MSFKSFTLTFNLALWQSQEDLFAIKLWSIWLFWTSLMIKCHKVFFGKIDEICSWLSLDWCTISGNWIVQHATGDSRYIFSFAKKNGMASLTNLAKSGQEKKRFSRKNQTGRTFLLTRSRTTTTAQARPGHDNRTTFREISSADHNLMYDRQQGPPGKHRSPSPLKLN